MNRLVLIGNGFDLAHGLKTSYADFINWYWDKRALAFATCYSSISDDPLCKFIDLSNTQWNVNAYMGLNLMPRPKNEVLTGVDVIQYIAENGEKYKIEYTPFFENILSSIETKGWVDIENEYYRLLIEYTIDRPSDHNLQELNKQLQFLQELLIEYLSEESKRSVDKFKQIEDKLYAPINTGDISVAGQKAWKEHVNYWQTDGYSKLENRQQLFGLEHSTLDEAQVYKVNPWSQRVGDHPILSRLPNRILLLNFNYTSTPRQYQHIDIADLIHIHGKLEEPANVIFGYGDELDGDFARLQNLNDNESLKNVKSIRYLETPNYRRTLEFIESEPFQVLIMGHSCGNSDRTLLNTIFEHPNCVSIKPYYYKKEGGADNYIELVQNISRNFNDMKLMRDRVVNKTQCEPLVKEE